jgi:hypothetical protein
MNYVLKENGGKIKRIRKQKKIFGAIKTIKIRS